MPRGRGSRPPRAGGRDRSRVYQASSGDAEYGGKILGVSPEYTRDILCINPDIWP